MKWEYKEVCNNAALRAEGKKMIDELNRLGREGWEVCGTISGDYGGLVFLKRPL